MLDKILVINVHEYRPNSLIEYVGRNAGGWKGSILGNQFKIGRDGDRDEVIEKYHRWLCEEVQNLKSPVRKEIERLAGKVDRGEEILLGCWCAPKKCHASVIKKAIVYVMQQSKGKEVCKEHIN